MAKQRFSEIERERNQILFFFPEFGQRKSTRTKSVKTKRRKRRLSRDQRAAVSKRMKAYWSKKKKGEA